MTELPLNNGGKVYFTALQLFNSRKGRGRFEQLPIYTSCLLAWLTDTLFFQRTRAYDRLSQTKKGPKSHQMPSGFPRTEAQEICLEQATKLQAMESSGFLSTPAKTTTMALDLPIPPNMSVDLVYRVCDEYGSSHRLELLPHLHHQYNRIHCLQDPHQ